MIMRKHMILGFLMGVAYFTLEGLWKGWTNIAMLFIGGLCAVLIGQLNDYPKYFKLKVWQQTLIGTGIILIIEFTSGMILNLGFGMHLWDYSHTWGNLYGQICVPYAFLWMILVPACIWLDDWLSWRLYGEGTPYRLRDNYFELITNR